MDTEDKELIRSFIAKFERMVNELETHSSYLNLSPEGEKLKEQAIGILKSKMKIIKKAKGKKDLKTVLKLKKIVEREES